ncbi:MAG: ROK family protein [Cellulomonadaceae bacterium]|nr:ROK family protein [Cellulomonadaceae bacterium]
MTATSASTPTGAPPGTAAAGGSGAPTPPGPDAAFATPVLDPQVASLAAVLDLVRRGAASTRPELERLTGLGRKLVALRVTELMDAGLLDEGPLGPSTGGRAPRLLRFVADAGLMLAAHFGATGMRVGVMDLAGRVQAQGHADHDIADGPEAALKLMLGMWDSLLAQMPARADGQRPPIWGVGVGVPGPVEFSTARPVSPPIMPGWHQFPVRERIQATWPVPVWVDNDVNAMALGELRAGIARGTSDLVYLKLGTGIGAGFISRGGLHRGAQGVAGDVGHIPVREQLGIACRCGRIDCLEAVAGGGALVTLALAAAQDGTSPVLAGLLRRDGKLRIRHLAEAAQHGDPTTVGMLKTSGRRVGEMLATLVNAFNPALVVLGGPLAEAGDLMLAAVRQAVYDRSLPLATRDLVITRSLDSDLVGITGSAFTVIDEIFAPDALKSWIGRGRPGIDLNPSTP